MSLFLKMEQGERKACSVIHSFQPFHPFQGTVSAMFSVTVGTDQTVETGFFDMPWLSSVKNVSVLSAGKFGSVSMSVRKYFPMTYF
jgi:hypothetical protein